MNRNYQNPFAEEEFSQHNGCRGKRGWPSRRHARGILRVMRKNGSLRPGSTLEPYHCHDCGRWHIGNNKRRQPIVLES